MQGGFRRYPNIDGVRVSQKWLRQRWYGRLMERPCHLIHPKTPYNFSILRYFTMRVKLKSGCICPSTIAVEASQTQRVPVCWHMFTCSKYATRKFRKGIRKNDHAWNYDHNMCAMMCRQSWNYCIRVSLLQHNRWPQVASNGTGCVGNATRGFN